MPRQLGIQRWTQARLSAPYLKRYQLMALKPILRSFPVITQDVGLVAHTGCPMNLIISQIFLDYRSDVRLLASLTLLHTLAHNWCSSSSAVRASSGYYLVFLRLDAWNIVDYGWLTLVDYHRIRTTETAWCYLYQGVPSLVGTSFNHSENQRHVRKRRSNHHWRTPR